jgi:hypothetical protein
VILKIDWLRPLVYTHRWLGIGGGLLLFMWFATGIVMMYHRMPEVGAAERLERLAAIDPTSIEVAPGDAAETAGAPGRRFSLAVLHGRPVYRFGVRTVYADSGALLEGLSAEEALAIAGDFSPDHRATLAYDALIAEPDQWTLQSRPFFPLHRIALGDEEDTRVYVSDRSGDVVMRTTRSERRWSYAGAVLHWLYFTPLRANPALWTQTIIWLSVAGCLLTLSGLLWGVLRFSPFRRHRPQGRRLARSPYTGLLKWHHYVGLVFGLFTFTWMLSGGLSMDPWSWHPETTPTAEQREGAARGVLRLDDVSARTVRAGAASLVAAGAAREIDVVRFRGEEYLVGAGDAGPSRTLLVSMRTPAEGVFERFADADVIDAAVEAMPGIGIRDLTWLDAYDPYYYDRSGSAPLPVLRVGYADPQETALYLDPRSGAILRKEERLTRLNRWLYHGLHSLDFPLLYGRRPLWDAVMIVLSLGGLAVSATTLWPAWKRLGRHVRRLAGR